MDIYIYICLETKHHQPAGPAIPADSPRRAEWTSLRGTARDGRCVEDETRTRSRRCCMRSASAWPHGAGNSKSVRPETVW